MTRPASPLWHRVSGLRPRLRSHARVHRHTYRGETWFVLQNRASRRVHRLNPQAYRLVALLDGERSVAEAMDLAAAELGEGAPTQDEVIRVLGQLHLADLLQAEIAPDLDELLRRTAAQERRRWLQYLISPLAMRFPLLDPDAALRRFLPYYRPLFTAGGFALWAAVVAGGLLLAAMHWRELTENLSDRVLSPQNLVIVALLFPLIKALHELGHACATRAWGGEVHEMGVMLLVLLPIPYVDASAASTFREARRRMVVGAAGMMVELFLAALAMGAWTLMEPGLLRAVMFNVMLIAGVSTVVFNGNPLLRFDGYYILGDALQMPNLGQRASRELLGLLQRRVLGLSGPAAAAPTAERAWLAGFGVASFLYRMVVMLGIALFVGTQYFFFGVLLALWAIATALLLPLAKGAAFVARLGGAQPRARAALAGMSLLALLVAVPLPQWTRTEGVVRVAEAGQVRAGADGFVTRVLVVPGQRVSTGDPIVELQDPLLRLRLAVDEARVAELEARYQAQVSENRALAARLLEELGAARAALERGLERSRALVLRAGADGEVVILRAEDLPGRFVRQGDAVAYVASPALLSARAVVSQESVDLVRSQTRRVELRLAHDRGETVTSRIQGEVPAASGRLPSPVLGTAGGGAAASDPRDPRGTALLQRQFEFEVALDGRHAGIGERVYVRFDHGYAPLAWQAYRALRQLFLARFSV
jgi:putative peptide zinc metalloprotease protein